MDYLVIFTCRGSWAVKHGLLLWNDMQYSSKRRYLVEQTIQTPKMEKKKTHNNEDHQETRKKASFMNNIFLSLLDI